MAIPEDLTVDTSSPSVSLCTSLQMYFNFVCLLSTYFSLVFLFVKSAAPPSNAASDIPEFCEMNLRLPQSLFHSSKLAIPSAIQESPNGASEDTNISVSLSCLQVPRQTLCLVHIQGREVRVHLYNWSRDDADRLLNRVESLVSWYNQRFQVGHCIFLW